MRLVYSTENQALAHQLSAFLTEEGILNQHDLVPNTDWGSSEYGDVMSNVWVINEEDFEDAIRWTEEFQKDPGHPRFKEKGPKMKTIFPQEIQPPQKPTESYRPLPKRNIGIVTLYLLMTCIIIYMTSTFTSPRVSGTIPIGVPAFPVVAAPIQKKLLYDYPEAYELTDSFIQAYGLPALQSPDNLPPNALYLLRKIQRTPHWNGFYELVVHYLKDPTAPLTPQTEMFVKEKQGQLWRLVTPILLHGNLLHILFNMLWLLVLGKQMEMKLGTLRYLVFIAFTAICSNTAQYLMSGEDFLGFSGVVCAMVGFIWIRQKRAPWEGYRLDNSAIQLITLFVLALAGIQTVYFVLEIMGMGNPSSGIANTAHIAGALSGIGLGYLNPFSSNS